MPVRNKAIPKQHDIEKEIPEESPKKDSPTSKPLTKEIPSDMIEENCVTINGTKVEIKPTKLKYFRNRTTSIYKLLKLIPLNQFLSYDKGAFDSERDSDQMLFDFLIAVFNDSSFVASNYDEMTSENIEDILKIFGRINHIDEKEEANSKNKKAQATSN